MGDADSDLTCTAKLVQVVLCNRGPLSASEIAEEARISADEARNALDELAREDEVESVCGVCSTKEEVYALTEPPEPRA